MIIFKLVYRFGKGVMIKVIEDATKYDNESSDSHCLL